MLDVPAFSGFTTIENARQVFFINGKLVHGPVIDPALLGITASDITDASANGRSLITAANYAAMKTLLGVTAADITDASANGRSLITAANYAAMLTLLGIEFGTWTPTVTFTTPGDISVSYGTQVGIYLKIGTWVILSFDLGFTATYTTSSGVFVITGLPIAATTSPAGNAVFVAGSVTPAYPAGATSIGLTVNVPNQQLRITGQGSASVTAFSATEFTSGSARSLRGSIIYT